MLAAPSPNQTGQLLVAVQAQLGSPLSHLVSVISRERVVVGGACSLSKLAWLHCGSSKESPGNLAAGAGRADDVKTARNIYPRAGESTVTRDKADEEKCGRL